MSATATPYGAKPVGTLSGSGSFSGKRRAYKIASGYDTSIFDGDFVTLVNTGTVEKDAGTTTMTPIGIFVGCQYTDPVTGQLVEDQYWPANTVADDAVAFVVDDPNVLFQIQADDTLAQTALGNNAAVVQTAGNATFKQSRNTLDASTIATTNTLPLRIVEFVDGPDSAVGDAFTDVICKFNAGHQLLNTTGV